MPSKLSVHLSGFPDRALDILQRMQPSVIKVFNFPSDMNIDALRARCPGAVIIYRQYTNLDYHLPADLYLAELSNALSKLHGRGIYWEGINEPVVTSAADAQALNNWFVRFAALMHLQGEKVAGFSWSTGNPPNLSLVIPYIRYAAAAVDLHAFHEYYNIWWKSGDWLRYRAFEAALPSNARRPVVITEAGLDNGGDRSSGYRSCKTEDEYMEILRAYDAALMQDPYALGATVYEWGDGNWPSFELSPMMDRLSSYVASVGGGVNLPRPFPLPPGAGANTPPAIIPPRPDVMPIPKPAPRPIPKPAPAPKPVPQTFKATYTFTANPAAIAKGETTVLKWDVEGAREVYLDGDGVAGHGQRAVKPQVTTTYTLHVLMTDGTTKDIVARVTVNPVPALDWDRRLDPLGVKVQRNETKPVWRLVKAQYLTATESQDRHHVLFKALRADGSPAKGVQFLVDWIGRDANDIPSVVVTDAAGEAGVPLWATMHIGAGDGIYIARAAQEQSDAVTGLGLASGERVSFALTFRYQL